MLQSTGQNQQWPTSGQSGYITPIPMGGPQRFKQGTKSVVAHKWTDCLCHPCCVGPQHSGAQTKSAVAHKWADRVRHLCRWGPSPSRHTVLLYLLSFVCPVAVGTKLIPIPRTPFAAGINRICVQHGYSPLVLCQQFSNVLSNLVLYPTVSAFEYLFCRLTTLFKVIFFYLPLIAKTSSRVPGIMAQKTT